MKRIGLCVALAAVSTVGMCQQIGLRAGISFFTGSELRNAFGNGKVSFGLGASRSIKEGYRLGGDLDFTIANKNGNRLLLIPLTYGFTSGLNREMGGQVMPYVAARGGIAYADYAIWRGGSRISEHKFLPTANLEAGLVLPNNLTLSARYNLYAKTRGFDFNGFTVAATWALR